MDSENATKIRSDSDNDGEAAMRTITIADATTTPSGQRFFFTRADSERPPSYHARNYEHLRETHAIDGPVALSKNVGRR